MDWVESLALIIVQTGHERYRELCADSHPDHLVWRSRVVARATGAPLESPPSLISPDRPTVAQSWDLTRAMHACPFWSRQPGCCTGARCALRHGEVVGFPDCFACLKRYG